MITLGTTGSTYYAILTVGTSIIHNVDYTTTLRLESQIVKIRAASEKEAHTLITQQTSPSIQQDIILYTESDFVEKKVRKVDVREDL